MIIVETERKNLTSMIDVDHLNYSINQHMKRIKEHSDCKKIMQLFQIMAEHSVKHAGMSFMSNKTMAKKLGVHVRTIQRYTKLLEQLLILLKIPTNRKKNRGQASNTYVILPVLKSAVSKVCHGVCHPLNPSFKPLKQESNTYKSDAEFIPTEIKNDRDFQTITKYMSLKLWEKVKKGYAIESLGALTNKFMNKEIDKILYLVQMKLNKVQQQGQQQQQRELPFYNWLEQ